MATARRIIDANANRAREALRVLEDHARFVLEHTDIATSLKTMRHEVTAATELIRGATDERDAEGDPGRVIETEREYERASIDAVLEAAAHRAGEALRSIEEYAKTIDPAAARRIERVRYDVYVVHGRLVETWRGRRRQWRICVLITESLCARPWLDVAAAALDGGADCLQLREKDLDDGELLSRARALVDLARGRADVVINDRADIAVLADATGVHLGQGDLPCAEARRIVGASRLVGVSTSTLDEARAAAAAGADVCGVGPMFPTTTKHKDTIAGPETLRRYVAAIDLPHLAIGGITPNNIAALVDAGVRGVAVSSAVCGASDPRRAVETLAGTLSDQAFSSSRMGDPSPKTVT